MNPIDGVAEAELADILIRLGPVADSQSTRAAVAQYEADIDDQAKTRYGTSVAGSRGPLPRFLPVRDVLRIIFNMDAMVVPDTVPRRMARSPRTTTEDTLALTLAYAPSLRAALDLVARYGDAVLPWYWRRITCAGDRLRIAYGPIVPMTRIEPLATEMALTTIHRIVETFVGDRIAAAHIKFAAPTVSTLPVLRKRFACAVSTGSDQSFVEFPLEWGEWPSPYHDKQLWLDGLARCEADIRAVREAPLVGRVRAHVAAGLDAGQIVTIADTAKALSLSSRSLVRALSRDGQTHHLIVDACRRDRARVLLAQSGLALIDISEKLGFPDQSSLGRKCREWFGESPARFRRQ